MKFDDLVATVGHLRWFDMPMLVQLTGESRRTITNQLYRFAKAGKVVPLRRGLYVLGEHFRRMPVQPAELANVIYRPSYLSLAWALSYYGLIPEQVPVFTSVSSGTTRRFQNPIGEFVYHNVKQELFFGYRALRLGGRKVLCATPEKALIDTWHLGSGEWTSERMAEMRFSSSELVSERRLHEMVSDIGKPRIGRAFTVWCTMMQELREGEVEL